MGYYGQGDYYARGGLFDVIKGIGSAVGGVLFPGVAPVISAIGGGSKPTISPGQLPVLPTPGIGGAISRALPGGSTGYYVDASGQVRKRRRKMNFANSRALGRANRRVDGFVRLAKRSLKHTNYKILTKQQGRGRRSSSPVIVESGPGNVIAR